MAKRRKHRNASRGSVNNIILRTLANGDKYGYEIIKEVEEYSDGKIKLKQPSLYSSLTRFEDKGLVTSYWGDSDIGGRRHYYHMTEAGEAYYRVHVLKKKNDENSEAVDDIDDEDEIIDDTQDDTQIEETDTTTPVVPDQVVESKIEIHEVDPSTIPSVVNFDDEEEEMVQIPSDYVYHEPTPLEIMSEENNNNAPQEEQYPWLELANIVKANNRKYSTTPYKRLHYVKPKQKRIIILDKDGIYKLRDADYVPSNEINKKPHIIDNVGRRTKDTSFGYADYTDNYNKKPEPETPKPIIEMTEEERKRRNEIFLAKFNELSKAKMKETPQTPVVEETQQADEEDIDYKSKLDIFTEDDIEEETTTSDENNLFNYIDEETEEEYVDFDDDTDTESPVQTPVEEEHVEEDDYNREISQYSANTIKINKYENAPKAVLLDRSYVLINKLRFIFGFVLLFILLAETTISVLAFNSHGLIGASDKGLIITTYILSVVLSLVFILPYLFSPNEHKLNNYKQKYAFLFGLLTFLICLILIYCFNALAGFELDNFKYFAVKLLLPTILSTNFIICPLIYGVFTKSKIFYD